MTLGTWHRISLSLAIESSLPTFSALLFAAPLSSGYGASQLIEAELDEGIRLSGQ